MIYNLWIHKHQFIYLQLNIFYFYDKTPLIWWKKFKYFQIFGIDIFTPPKIILYHKQSNIILFLKIITIHGNRQKFPYKKLAKTRKIQRILDKIHLFTKNNLTILNNRCEWIRKRISGVCLFWKVKIRFVIIQRCVLSVVSLFWTLKRRQLWIYRFLSNIACEIVENWKFIPKTTIEYILSDPLCFIITFNTLVSNFTNDRQTYVNLSLCKQVLCIILYIRKSLIEPKPIFASLTTKNNLLKIFKRQKRQHSTLQSPNKQRPTNRYANINFNYVPRASILLTRNIRVQNPNELKYLFSFLEWFSDAVQIENSRGSLAPLHASETRIYLIFSGFFLIFLVCYSL